MVGCLTKFLEFFEEVIRKVDEGKAVDVICMDFSKAHDRDLQGILV